MDLADDVQATITRLAQEEGLAAEQARRLGRACLMSLQERWGCGSHYFRAKDRTERDQKALELLRAGQSSQDVGRVLGVAACTVRRIAARAKRRRSFGPQEWEL
ncbi:MAG: hypothetical protein EOM21_17145 [Gammaproteobacteria bacterium]|nr:hypothetical protein [Gammaproteobacteria bacterium]